MKKIISISAFVFAVLFTSCKTDQMSIANAKKSTDKCQGDPPEWCAKARCSSEGKPVCGCNGVTYANECQAQCDGVTSYTFGTCDAAGGGRAAKGF